MNTNAIPQATPEIGPTAPSGRLTIDAPMRAFHWLFALSFTGAWLTAESERWRAVHETLGYAFGGLLLFRLVYGLIGPKQARLSLLWRRASGWGGALTLSRLATLAMASAMLLLLAIAAPLVLSGYAGENDWLGLSDPLEELHEFFANTALTLVLAHLALIALLSVLRRKNLAAPMFTGRTPGPGADVVKANRRWLALLVVVGCLGFVGWQLQQDAAGAGIDGGAGSTTDGTTDGTIDGEIDGPAMHALPDEGQGAHDRDGDDDDDDDD